MQEKGRCQYINCKKGRNYKTEISPGIIISVCPKHNRMIAQLRKEENEMLSKSISSQMREFHEEEDRKVIPITNKATTGGFRRDNWLKDLPLYTNFLTYNGGMYLTEWTILGKRGNPIGEYVLLREDIFDEGIDNSNKKWTNSSLFCLQNELKEILND